MKIPIESSKKKSVYSVCVYGALDVRLFPNKRFNVHLKNIEIHGFTWPSKIFKYLSELRIIGKLVLEK